MAKLEPAHNIDKMVQVGELIPPMTQVFQAGLDRCIGQNKHRRELYYILFHASWLRNHTQLNMTFAPRDRKPPKMLNTMLWSVNNKTGELKQLWVLPPDAPVQETKHAQIVDSIAKDVEGIPIIY